MKTIITLTLALVLGSSIAQDLTPITVNIRDNARLQWGGAVVKMKAVVLQFRPVSEQSKDFVLHLSIQMYENNAGAYGSKITDLISADVTLTADEKTDLLDRYRDREVIYSTAGKYVDATGERVASDAPGAIPEIQYWQTFKMNNAALGMTSASTQGALDGIYKIAIAIVNKLNARKNI
jgi:hypothetical protein